MKALRRKLMNDQENEANEGIEAPSESFLDNAAKGPRVKKPAKAKVVGEDGVKTEAEETAEEKSARKRQPKTLKKPSMILAWGATFSQAAEEGKDINWVKETMLSLHPEKAETIEKWTPWYANFYNMGRIKGYENAKKLGWQSEKQKAREEKKAREAQERLERVAAKEAAKAEKQAKQENKVPA